MNASDICQQLEHDFVTPQMTDSWAEYMGSVSDYLTESFRQRSMGLVCDHTKTVNKVYTAVFASDSVMQTILDRGESDMMLFVHHPESWEFRTSHIWLNMNRDLLQRFKENRISIFNFHVPLDNFGEYSTGVSLARKVGIEISKPFFNYYGAMAGLFGKTHFDSLLELARSFGAALGHRTSLYEYGAREIRNGMVAVVAGGGLLTTILEEIVAQGCNVLMTGITIKNDRSHQSHEYASDHGINILGGTHYSTEKPACQAMCRYFTSLGLASEFIEGVPVLEDL